MTSGSDVWWNVLEAISVYDKLKTYDSIVSLLQAMRNDKAKTFVETIENLMNMNCMKTRQEQEQAQVGGGENEGRDSEHSIANVDRQQTITVRIAEIADTITNHGEFNVVNNKYCVNDPLCKAEYNANKEQQTNSSSLCSLGLLYDLVLLLGCEAKYKATKTLYLKEGNYDGRSNLPAKYIDALGILKTHNNMEMVVVESPRY
ncbi:hypothetical protein V8B55DRAFT_1563853 [Mucor lusitanicus]